MADNKDAEDLRDSMAGANEEISSLYEQLRGITSELKGQLTEINKSRTVYRSFEKVAQDFKLQFEGINRLSDTQIKNYSQLLNTQIEIARQEGKRLVDETELGKELNIKINQLKEQKKNQDEINDAVLEHLKTNENLTIEQKALIQEYFKGFEVLEKIKDKAADELIIREKVTKSLGIAGNSLKALNQLAGGFGKAFKLEKVIDDMEVFAEKTIRTQGEVSRLAVLGKGLQSAFGNLKNTLTDPSIVIGSILKSFGEFEKQNREVRKLTGQTADNYSSFNMSAVSAIDQVKTIATLTKEIGINANAAFSKETILAATELSELLGVSAKATANLALRAEASGTSLKGVDNTVAKTVSNFNSQNRSAVAFNQVMEDVGNASNSLSLSLGNNPEKLAKAAAEAANLGLNLQSAERIADSLLNFESSISAELEAELLTGKELNLEKARSAALNNDIEGMLKEIGDNQEIINSFSSGNRIQQEAIAKSLGMSKEEVSKMILLQQKNLGLTDEQAAKAAGISLEEAKRLSVQASIQKSIEKITAAFAPILDIVAKLVGNTGVMSAVFAVIAISYIPKLVSGFKSISGGFSSFLKSGKDASKPFEAAINASKSLVKTVTDSVKNISQGISNVLTNLSSSVKNVITNVSEGIGNALTNISEGIGNALTNISEGIENALTNISEGIGNALTNISEGIGNALTNVSEGIGNALTNVSEGIGNAIRNISTGLGSAIRSILSSIGQGLIAMSAGVAAFNVAGGPIFLLTLGVALAGLGVALGGAAMAFEAIAEGFVSIFESITLEGISNLFLLGPALLSASAGLMSFAVAMGVASIAMGVGSILGGGPIKLISDLAALSNPLKTASSALSEMASAFLGVSTALNEIDGEKLEQLEDFMISSAISNVGQVISSAIASPIAAIGNAIGGNSKDSSSQELQEIKELLSKILQKESIINLDSEKVGTGFALGTVSIQ
jgi:hypothetical protein